MRPIDAYRIFFPLGLIHALLGCNAWILFYFGKIPHPILVHKHHMYGFLLSFICGFLMTAVPRFTGTRAPTFKDYLIPILISFFSLFLRHSAFSSLFYAFLLFFVTLRFKHKKGPIAPYFMFIPVGLSLGLLGSFTPSPYLTSMSCFFFLIVGIGTRIIPMILGHSSPSPHSKEPSLLALFLVLSFGLDMVRETPLGPLIRASILSFISYRYWKIHKSPIDPSPIGFWVRISGILMFLFSWMQVINFHYNTHFAHLIFINGFGLITLGVASRVVAAHGGYLNDYSQFNRKFFLFGSCILLSSLMRGLAPHFSEYFFIITIAAVFWLIGIGTWGLIFIPKIIKLKFK